MPRGEVTADFVIFSISLSNLLDELDMTAALIRIDIFIFFGISHQREALFSFSLPATIYRYS